MNEEPKQRSAAHLSAAIVFSSAVFVTVLLSLVRAHDLQVECAKSDGIAVTTAVVIVDCVLP